MRVAVLGGGTAGFMAAAHLTKHFPMLDLYHIHDSRIPTIGVGEGTTPPFVRWVHEITGLTFEELQSRCSITHKDGIRFEDWGRTNPTFAHYFSLPEGGAYHLSASGLVHLLRDYVVASTIDARVTDVFSDGHRVRVTLEDEQQFTFDFVFDARGFPDPGQVACRVIHGIPTNGALVVRTRLRSSLTATRAVARPFGWIFVIPLTTDTAYGYIFDGMQTSRDEVERDLREVLEADHAEPSATFRHLRFPNFIRRRFFDGALFAIGNAASFIEPLEATAIGITLEELRIASFWLLEEILQVSKTGESEKCLAIVNDHLFELIEEAALFVSWHYAKGSSYDTPFWRQACARFEIFRRETAALVTGSAFEAFVAGAANWPSELALVDNRQAFARIPIEQGSNASCGSFRQDSFAKVGHGIGYFELPTERAKPRGTVSVPG